MRCHHVGAVLIYVISFSWVDPRVVLYSRVHIYIYIYHVQCLDPFELVLSGVILGDVGLFFEAHLCNN